MITPLLVLAMLGITAPPAFADPVDEKRGEAEQIKQQIAKLDEQLEIAAEQYNEARDRYEKVTKEMRSNEARIAELTAKQQTLQAHLSTRMASMYRQGPLGVIEILLSSSSFEELATTWDILQKLNEQDAAQVDELKATRAELERAQAELASQQAEAKAQAEVMKSRKAKIGRQLAERSSLLEGVEAEIAQILRDEEEAARKRAEAAAAAAAAAAARASSGSESAAGSQAAATSQGGNPSKAPRSSVVSIALSKLGAPYSWGAAGPGSFDCSGFTMWCYAQVGVSLPHSSRAQIGAGQRVSRSNLAPGDLVFFGTGTIHHVGIYVGNNSYVHAPHTGDVVKVSSLGSRSDYVGACRP